jgi:hypothetical protein
LGKSQVKEEKITLDFSPVSGNVLGNDGDRWRQMEVVMKFYWFCDKCGKEKTYEETASIKEARIELEKHEAEKHKKKQIGTFGIQYNA